MPFGFSAVLSLFLLSLCYIYLSIYLFTYLSVVESTMLSFLHFFNWFVFSLPTPVCLEAACWFFPVGQCGSLADACLVDGQLLRQRGSFSRFSFATAWCFSKRLLPFSFLNMFGHFAFIRRVEISSNRKDCEYQSRQVGLETRTFLLHSQYLTSLSHHQTSYDFPH